MVSSEIGRQTGSSIRVGSTEWARTREEERRACHDYRVSGSCLLHSCYLAAGLIVLLVLKQPLWINFVEIRMAVKELSLDPVLIFLWHAYWGWAWGVLGFILDYAMLAAVRIVLRLIRGCVTWTTLLSDE